MIKLIRPKKPKELTLELEKALVEEFKKTKKVVWRLPCIVENLKEMSHEKCCFCETKLGTQSRAMHVEHFHYKEGYPDEVVSWENLLPSCQQCNSNKSTYDTIKDGEIIEPTIDDPKEYLYLKQFMIRSKDNRIGSKGRNTVDLLDLNNRKRLINPRIQIADTMRKTLEKIHEMALVFADREDGKQYNKKRIINGMKDILDMAQPDAEYSAFMATIILTDEDYKETKEILKSSGLWDSELERLDGIAETLRLDENNN